eukprot:CAMPEP_0171863218 /NCGR_PEP_ID=MMETSP0992-20121227/28125_1 /TAXON_ID=483369 /ORGANISM="non described non described, Strain CCMP2098" /LENGTH=82 /DNA_ID=CAMNT_0012485545 /DNA_START=69 /DNA_END=317 /DNA_ORIENTATION=+
MDLLFSSFDPTPIGAASIAQAHHATLADGTAVVVKVQYPEVASFEPGSRVEEAARGGAGLSGGSEQLEGVRRQRKSKGVHEA